MALWYATQATVSVGDAISVIDTTTDLSTDFTTNASGTSFSADLKEITFGGGEAGVDVLNVFSTQLKEEKRPDLRTCEMTLIFPDMDALEWFGNSTQTEASPVGDYKRWNFADNTGNRANKSILISITDATNHINVIMNNAYFTTSGEITLSADGSAEVSMSASCLISDFAAEDDI